MACTGAIMARIDAFVHVLDVLLRNGHGHGHGHGLYCNTTKCVRNINAEWT
jgi:hypothetical protein